MLSIELKGESLQLLPERAIFWEKEKTLIIADLHWGKAAHFRKHGIAIPLQAQADDESRLARLLHETHAERLVIAGDLFHSRSNHQVAVFDHFRQHHSSVHIDLVIGNHDILGEEQYSRFGIQPHKDFFVSGPFCFAHDAIQSPHFVLHGHVHPAISIKNGGHRQPALKLSCFAQDAERLILPAFGKFTGTHLLQEKEFHHLYVIADSSVIQWK